MEHYFCILILVGYYIVDIVFWVNINNIAIIILIFICVAYIENALPRKVVAYSKMLQSMTK